MSSSAFVYLLICSDNATYVGATVDLDKRLRQHNGEISGGAVMTTSKVKKGKNWSRVCYVSGFPDWRAALQFEWRWKQISRKISPSISPIERRFKSLHKLLSLDKSTSKAIPYNQWTNLPEITFENNIYESLYNSVVVYNPVEPNPPDPLDVVPKSSTETMSSTKKGFNVG
jgi:predicted GIY-YIG superfamily endonuclease